MNMAWIKKVYLYMVSLISLVILVIASIMLINLVLKTWIFTEADNANYYEPKLVCTETKNPDGSMAVLDPQCSNPNYEEERRAEEERRRSAQRQSNTAEALAMILVGSPVFLYHWKLARKEA